MTERKKYTSVEDYMGEFSGETKKRLNELRDLIKKLAPESTEWISYNIPATFIGKAIEAYIAQRATIARDQQMLSKGGSI